MKTVAVFCDMDGCIARWNPKASIEETYEPGYFLHRRIDSRCAAMIRALRDEHNINVIFLSAVYGEMQAKEKRDWLDKYGYKNNVLITCPYGECKREFIKKNFPEYISDVNILIDDFTQNLQRWQLEPEFIGVKYLNGINDTNKSWTGIRINTKVSYYDASDTIASIA